jgi:hypothetical protein
MEKTLVPRNSGRTITCKCGYEIIIQADATTLGSQIDKHIEEHINKMKESTTSIETSEKLSNYIYKQLFQKISKNHK